MQKLALCLFFFLPIVAFGQSPITLNAQGEKFFNNGQYAQAMQYYLQALDTEPNNQMANYQVAECYRLTLKYQEAEQHYEKMVKLSEENYPMSRYYYALMQKMNGKYDQAMPNFQLFIDRFDRTPAAMERYQPFRLQAMVEREGCLLALNELSNPVTDNAFTVLEPPINSEYDDYAPFLFNNNTSLVITSSRRSATGSGFDARMGQSKSDIFRFTYNNGVWEETKSNDKFSVVNSKENEGTGIFNRDYTKLYFTYNPPDNSVNPSLIYMSQLIGGKWSEPKPLNANINARNSESRHPSLTPGNDTLFFVSNRPGGQGQYDIWYSIDAGVDNWGPPVNLGPSINTPLDEVAPFYDQKENVLFFSSNGHRGFGGFDVFMTSGNQFDNSEIYNMGYPYNSNRDDLFFILGEHTGYVTTGREGGVGSLDIYSFSIQNDEEVIAEVLKEEAIAGRTSVFSDDYNFQTTNIEKVDEIISHLLAARMFNTEVMLTTEELAFYENLSASDKEKIERIINSRIRKMSENDLRAVRTEDEFYYQQLSSGDKYAINRMVSSYIEEDGLAIGVHLSEEEKAYYEQLSKDSKEKVDQYITMKVTEYRKKEVTDPFYETLPEADKRQVKTIARSYLIQKKALPNLTLNVNNNIFLNKQGEENIAKAETSILNQLKNLSLESDFELTGDDKIFYQNLTTDERASIDHLVSAFLASKPSDFEKNIAPADLAFYNTKPAPQKALIDKIVAKRIRNLSFSDEVMFNSASSQQVELLASLNTRTGGNVILSQVAGLISGAEREKYNSLASPEKLRFGRMIAGADKYEIIDSPIFSKSEESAQPVNLFAAGTSSQAVPAASIAGVAVNRSVQQLDASAKMLYEGLPAARKNAVDRIVAVSVLNQAYRDNPQLPELNSRTFDQFTATEKAAAKRIAQYFTIEGLTQAELNRVQQDLSYYNQLPADTRSIFNQMVLREALALSPGKTQLELTRNDQQVLSQLRPEEVSMASSLAGVGVNSNLIFGQNSLQGKSVAGLQASVPAENTTIPGRAAEIREEGEIIVGRADEGTGVAKVPTNRTVEVIDAKTISIYENLPVEKKKALDRIVAVALLNKEYQENPQLPELDNRKFEEFSSEDRRVARRLARYLTDDNLSPTELATIQNDFTYYGMLPTEARGTFNHYILKEAFNLSPDTRQMELPAPDKKVLNQLNPEEKELVTSLVGIRAKSNFLFGNNLELENKFAEAGTIIASVDQFLTASYRNLKIQGKLIEIETGKPKAHFPVMLTNAAGENIKMAHTNHLGEFVFDYLDGNKAYKIISSKRTEGAYEPNDFFIKDMQVRGYREGFSVVEYESIYFNSDASAIREEGFVSLKKLIQLYKQHPEIEIEIHAHADNTGEHDYNHKLANKRGEVVYDYLVKNGVDETAITVYTKGEGEPVASNLTAYGRAFNRRVELEIYSSRPLQADIAKFYVVRPKGKLANIAKEFGLTEAQVLKMNGLTSNTIKPYTPVRIEGRRDVKPSLNLLVELNDHAVNYKQYTVKTGDSIISIAQKFNLPEELLIELNDLQGHEVVPGSVIDIYVSY